MQCRGAHVAVGRCVELEVDDLREVRPAVHLEAPGVVVLHGHDNIVLLHVPQGHEALSAGRRGGHAFRVAFTHGVDRPQRQRAAGVHQHLAVRRDGYHAAHIATIGDAERVFEFQAARRAGGDEFRQGRRRRGADACCADDNRRRALHGATFLADHLMRPSCVSAHGQRLHDTVSSRRGSICYHVPAAAKDAAWRGVCTTRCSACSNTMSLQTMGRR